MAQVQRARAVLRYTPVKSDDATVCGISAGVVGVVLEEKTCTAKSGLKTAAGAEERAVVDGDFDWFVDVWDVEA